SLHAPASPPSPPSPPVPVPPPADPPAPVPPIPPAPPPALPALLATLPRPETPLPVTVPLSWVVATTVLELVLNESVAVLVVLAVAVLLLSAAALPAPEAMAWVMLSRLLPRVELLSPAFASFWSWAMSWPEAPSTTRTAAVRMLYRMRIGRLLQGCIAPRP